MGNAQSGRSSARGLCIESVFRTVPHTGTAIGVSGSNPHRFWAVEPGGGYSTKPTKEVGDKEIDGDFSIHRVTMTGKNYDGKDSWKLDPENLYYPGLGILGRDVEETLASGAYKHVMTPGKYMPSFTDEESFGDATSGRLSSGVCVHTLKLTHSAILMAEADYYAFRQIPNTYPNGSDTDTDYDFISTAGVLPIQMGGDGSATVGITAAPSYVDVAEGNDGNGPLVYANMKFGSEADYASTFVTIDGTPFAAKFVPGYTCELMREIERWMIGGSGYDAGQPVSSVFKASGKLEIIFEDNTIPAKVLKNARFGFNMKFVGPEIGSTGQFYTYELFLPRVKFLDANVLRTEKTIMTGGSFVATKDPVLGYECKVTLINSFTNAALGGKVSDSPGGLGGWLNS